MIVAEATNEDGESRTHERDSASFYNHLVFPNSLASECTMLSVLIMVVMVYCLHQHDLWIFTAETNLGLHSQANHLDVGKDCLGLTA